MEFRVILYHKQATSARTRFVLFDNNTVLAFGAVPKLVQLLDNGVGKTAIHPTAVMRQTEQLMGLAEGSLKAEAEYQHAVEIPGATVQILLANITTMDPPFAEIEKAGAGFIDLTQARGLPQHELELLRYAYELVLGG